MLAQRLRHRVSLERPIVTADETSGAKSEAWEPVLLDQPAEKYALSGSEFIAAATTQMGITTRWTLRYHPDAAAMNGSWRIVHNGVPYNIVALLPDFKESQWFTIMTGSGVNDG